MKKIFSILAFLFVAIGYSQVLFVNGSTTAGNTDQQQLTISGDTLYLQNGGFIFLGPYLDNTDSQVFDQAQLNGNILELSLSGDGEATKTISLAAFSGSLSPYTPAEYAALTTPQKDTLNAVIVDDTAILGTFTDDQTATEVTIADAGVIITATDVEGALQENRTAIDLNTAKVTNATHTGDVTGATALTIGADKILESMLKSVNAPTDEYVLTYEATTGDFEWQVDTGGTPSDVAYGVSWNANTDATSKNAIYDEMETRIDSDTTGTSAASARTIDNIISLNQSDYTALTPDADTFYVVTDATSQLTDNTDVNTATVTAGNILVADGVDFESVAVSGDVTLASSGAVTIGASKVLGSMILDGTIDELDLDTSTNATLDLADSAVIQIACSDLTTDITTGTSKAYFRMPYAMTLTSVRVSLLTAGTTTGLTVDVNESGTTILSTKLTTDATEKTSETAATNEVVSDSSLADDAEITIDFDAVPTGGKGVIVTLIGTRS